MSSPVQISDLPVASSAVNGDLMLLRKGLTDYQINVTAIRQLDLTVFAPVPAPQANDLLFLQRGANVYAAFFSQVGLVQNTKAWFYQNTAPPGWSIMTGTGDKLLAVAGTSPPGYTIAGIGQGSWQQEGVNGGIPGGGLTPAQLPPHTHIVPGGKDDAGSSLNPGMARRGRTFDPDNPIPTDGGTGLTGSPHNHGSSWRPLANVGIICNKDS